MILDRRAILEQLRERLLGDLAECEARESASISRELRAVALELESLPGAEVSTVDDLARRRAQRLAEAAGQ